MENINLYKKMIDSKNAEENKIKEERRLKNNKKALEYYYKNREKILEQHRAKKLYNQAYYRMWYRKNRDALTYRRYGYRLEAKKKKQQEIQEKLDKLNKDKQNGKNRFILFG